MCIDKNIHYLLKGEARSRTMFRRDTMNVMAEIALLVSRFSIVVILDGTSFLVCPDNKLEPN